MRKRRIADPTGRETFPATVDPKPVAEVICCIDPRFQAAFQGFIKKTLKLRDEDVVILTIAGGPAPLAHPDDMRSRCRYIIRQTMFSCDHFPIKRVILIGHQDCGYYSVIPTNGSKSQSREKDDLPVAIKMLDLVVAEGVTIEAYYAFFSDASCTQIAFQKVA